MRLQKKKNCKKKTWENPKSARANISNSWPKSSCKNYLIEVKPGK